MENNKEGYRELNDNETGILLQLLLIPNVDELYKELMTQPGGWVLEAIDKRFAVHNITIDKKVSIMVLSLGNGLIGKCAKYVDDIANHKYKEVTFDILNTQIYPNGVPNF